MQSISIILSALTLGATAATIRTARSDPHIVDFRTFGATGCSEENQGVYTYVKSDLDKCFQFSETDVVESLFVSDITKGCSVLAYRDADCKMGEVNVPVGIDHCFDAPAGLFSYKTVCS